MAIDPNNYSANMQRNAITQALMNVQNPPPRTQVPPVPPTQTMGAAGAPMPQGVQPPQAPPMGGTMGGSLPMGAGTTMSGGMPMGGGMPAQGGMPTGGAMPSMGQPPMPGAPPVTGMQPPMPQNAPPIAMPNQMPGM
jgi:hypothetical protein